MAVGKYTPNIAVQGDIVWVPKSVKIWKSLGSRWVRFKNMEEHRLNKRTFKWCVKHGENRCKNWFYKFRNRLSSLELHFIFDENEFYTKTHILRIITCRWGTLPITWDASLGVSSVLGGGCKYVPECVLIVYIICIFAFFY